jgi:hypothetical protein
MDGIGGGAACVLVLGGRESNKKGRQGQTGEKRRNRAAAGARGRQTRRHGIGRVFRSIEGGKRRLLISRPGPVGMGPSPYQLCTGRQGAGSQCSTTTCAHCVC